MNLRDRQPGQQSCPGGSAGGHATSTNLSDHAGLIFMRPMWTRTQEWVCPRPSGVERRRLTRSPGRTLIDGPRHDGVAEVGKPVCDLRGDRRGRRAAVGWADVRGGRPEDRAQQHRRTAPRRAVRDIDAAADRFCCLPVQQASRNGCTQAATSGAVGDQRTAERGRSVSEARLFSGISSPVSWLTWKT